MNKFLSYLTVAITVVSAMALTACNKNDDKKNSSGSVYADGYATTPQPCNLGNQYNNGYGPNYNQNYYGPYGQYNNTSSVNCNSNGQYYGPNGYYRNYYGQQNWYHGAWWWPNQWQPNTGYCGCPIGYMPVYSQAYGVACAPNAYFNNSYVVGFNFNYSYGYPQNNHWLNNAQVQYNAPAMNCMDQTARGCDTRLQNCPTGAFCQAAGGGSTMGLCVRN